MSIMSMMEMHGNVGLTFTDIHFHHWHDGYLTLSHIQWWIMMEWYLFRFHWESYILETHIFLFMTSNMNDGMFERYKMDVSMDWFKGKLKPESPKYFMGKSMDIDGFRWRFSPTKPIHIKYRCQPWFQSVTGWTPVFFRFKFHGDFTGKDDDETSLDVFRRAGSRLVVVVMLAIPSEAMRACELPMKPTAMTTRNFWLIFNGIFNGILMGFNGI